MLVPLLIFVGLGGSAFTVDENFTTAPYVQSPTTLFLSGPLAAGDVVFGSFAGGPQDWSAVDLVSLSVALDGSNPGVFFELTLVDDSFEPIARYEGSSEGVGPTFQLLPLHLTQAGTGDPARFSGLQIVWNGTAEAGSGLALQSLVGSAGPVAPTITTVNYGSGGFTMTWTGTGDLPVNIERRAVLEAGGWTEVAQQITGGSYTDNNPPTGKAFYRVVVP